MTEHSPEHSVGDRVRDAWHGWVTIVEILDRPAAVVAPRALYRVDVGGGWTIWPQDILESAENE